MGRIPWSSPTAIAYAAAGLKPMWYHIYKATVNFYKKIYYERDSPIFHDLKVELESLGKQSPLVHRTELILQELGCTLESFTEERLYEHMIRKVNEEISKLSSCWLVG